MKYSTGALPDLILIMSYLQEILPGIVWNDLNTDLQYCIFGSGNILKGIITGNESVDIYENGF